MKKSKSNQSPDKIVLKPEDAKIIKNFENNLIKDKIKLADLEIYIKNLENNRNELINHITGQSSNLVSRVQEMAKSYGINEKENDKWNLNTDEMFFHKN